MGSTIYMAVIYARSLGWGRMEMGYALLVLGVHYFTAYRSILTNILDVSFSFFLFILRIALALKSFFFGLIVSNEKCVGRISLIRIIVGYFHKM